ncbi:MAG: hypothetical protein HZB53_06460 [Chloroflexi bacterium]|nr:hypothetical protein [Chloroflexota bacterium]
MNTLARLASYLSSPRLIWLLVLLGLLAAALAGGAPDGGLCPGIASC